MRGDYRTDGATAENPGFRFFTGSLRMRTLFSVKTQKVNFPLPEAIQDNFTGGTV